MTEQTNPIAATLNAKLGIHVEPEEGDTPKRVDIGQGVRMGTPVAVPQNPFDLLMETIDDELQRTRNPHPYSRSRSGGWVRVE